MITGGGLDIAKTLSFSRDAQITTGYAQDYAVRGMGFQVQKRITLTDSQTYYIVLDTTPLVGSNKLIFTLPLQLKTAGGLVYADTYAVESYAGGDEIIPLNLNAASSNVASSVLKKGVTPSAAISDPREYVVGTKSTNQSSGAGSQTIDVAKTFPAGSIIIAKFVNQETSDVTVEFGLVFFEVPI